MMEEELKLEAMEERASYEAEIARLREALEEIVATQIYFDGHAVVIAEKALEKQ